MKSKSEWTKTEPTEDEVKETKLIQEWVKNDGGFDKKRAAKWTTENHKSSPAQSAPKDTTREALKRSADSRSETTAEVAEKPRKKHPVVLTLHPPLLKRRR